MIDLFGRPGARFAALFLFAGLLGTPAVQATPIELLTNGGFETGTTAGWTINDAGSGQVTVESGNAPPNGLFPTVGPSSGQFYAVTSQGGPGTHALRQSFSVVGGAASVILSFDMFVQTNAQVAIHPNGLDHTAFPNQHARVDILSAGASAFDTGAGVLQNFYLGIDGTPTQPYTNYSFDITSLVSGGGTFQVRFAQVDNQGNFNLGVDNASILQTVPAPATLLLLGVALAGTAASRRRAG